MMMARSLAEEEANVTTQKKKPKPVEIDTFTVYKLDAQDRRLRHVIESEPPVEIPLHSKHGAGTFAIVDGAVAEQVRAFRWRLQLGYALASVYLHHLVLPIFGVYTSAYGEHANGNTLDNRIDNLRAANARQSSRNRRTWGASRFRRLGIPWHPVAGRDGGPLRLRVHRRQHGHAPVLHATPPAHEERP